VFDEVRARISPEKVAEYVVATSDDPDRWTEAAPPSYGGALLFMTAPLFLDRADVKAHTRVLVHVDQRFDWYGPLTIGASLTLVGRISKVRARGATTFVTFDMAATFEGGVLLDSRATFLLGQEPASEPGIDPGEPEAGVAGPNEVPSGIAHSGAGSPLPSLAKSASRVDLVRYAGASGDFNPIHYDHDAARGAGLSGIVVHGLLMGAWMSQLAAATSPRPDPLQQMRLRFRNALRPAAAATVHGRIAADSPSRVDLVVKAGEADIVTGHATVRIG